MSDLQTTPAVLITLNLLFYMTFNTSFIILFWQAYILPDIASLHFFFKANWLGIRQDVNL